MNNADISDTGTMINSRPWLTFRIDEGSYALDSMLIQTIMKKPEDIVAMPDAPSYIRGMANIRGGVIPVLDLRNLYGIVSLEDEYEEFKTMIDTRKNDHVEWLVQLERSAETGEPFTLPRSAYECAFGRWYYSFVSEHHSINFMLKKLEEPHIRLHEIASEVLACSQEHDKCKRDECLKITMKNTKEELMPQILGLLDELKEVFHHQYQEKLIVLEGEGRKIGIVVDAVSAIDYLTEAAGHEEFTQMTQSGYISSVARGQKSDELILVVEGNRLLDLVQDGQPMNKPGI